MDEIFDERYKLIRIIGQGAMATVYDAEQISTARRVALKVLNNNRSVDERSASRFKREAKVLTSLSHPNILSVYAYGVCAEKPYMALEFLAGKSMKDILSESGKMSWQKVLEIMKQLCEGVQYAHESGVVHRDLKPANIMLTPAADGSTRVKVVDFGISTFTAFSADQKLTAPGSIIGTPNYMSPEQCRGEQADSRSDVYALGCILYELCCGEKVVSGNTVLEVISDRASGRALQGIALDKSIPPRVLDVVAKAMMPEKSQRYASCTALWQDLEVLAAGGKIGAAQQHRLKRNPTGILAVCLATTAVVALVFYIVTNPIDQPARKPAASKLEVYARDSRFLRPPSKKNVDSAAIQIERLFEQAPPLKELSGPEKDELVRHRFDADLFMQLASAYASGNRMPEAFSMFEKSQQEMAAAVQLAMTKFKDIPMIEYQFRSTMAYWQADYMRWTLDDRLRIDAFNKAMQQIALASKKIPQPVYQGWLRSQEATLYDLLAQTSDTKRNLQLALQKYDQSIALFETSVDDVERLKHERRAVAERLNDFTAGQR